MDEFDELDSKDPMPEQLEKAVDGYVFKSHCTMIEGGPPCRCAMAHAATHFNAFLRDEHCGKDISEMKSEETVEFEASTVCPCQEGHTYKVTLEPGKTAEFEEIPEENCDSRKLRLPNWREF